VNEFWEGQKASVMKHGVEVEMIVFRQSGELVSLFDRSHRFYLFHVRDVQPLKTSHSSISICDISRQATLRENS
jgi:hypothetical protein